MPARPKQPGRKVDPGSRKPTQGEALHGQHRPQHVYRAGHDTRINAFVNSLGRRNQAKRDAR